MFGNACLSFTMQLVGECLKRLTRGVLALMVYSEAWWARMPEVQVRIPSVEGNGHFFPSYRLFYLLSFSDTHTHTHTHTQARTPPPPLPPHTRTHPLVNANAGTHIPTQTDRQTDRHTHTQIGVGVFRSACLCFTMELVGKCLKSLFRLMRDVLTPVV